MARINISASRYAKKIFAILAFLSFIHVTTFVLITLRSDPFAVGENFFQKVSKNTAKNFQSQNTILKEHGKLSDQANEIDPRSQLDIKVLFIGVKKCGTSTLKVFIGSHPDVIISNSPHVCAPAPYPSYEPMFSFLEYANSTNKVAIVENNECFHNIKEFDRLKKPSKIILLLCDPTLRAYSDYKHIVRTFGYEEKFEKVVLNAISFIEDHKNDKNFADIMASLRYQGHLDYSVVTMGFYYEYVKEYINRYQPEDILILSGAQLKQDPYLVTKKLESFLGVRHYLDRSKFVKNEDSGMYCIRQLFGSIQCIRPNISQFPSPDQATMEKLKYLYRQHNKKLYQLLNEDFRWL